MSGWIRDASPVDMCLSGAHDGPELFCATSLYPGGTIYNRFATRSRASADDGLSSMSLLRVEDGYGIVERGSDADVRSDASVP